jgi:hypothetical protein
MYNIDTTSGVAGAAASSPELLAGVARAAMLVDLHISTYTGRRKDRATQDEVVASKGANNKHAASVYKSLFAGCKELEDIIKFQAKMRTRHYSMTFPWSDSGLRLLPTAGMQKYFEVMNDLTDEFDDLVKKFLDKYDTVTAAAAFELGTLFNRKEYPLRSELASKYGVHITTFPLPLAGDFRLDIEREVQADLVKQYEARAQSMVERVNRDAWERLYKTLTRMSDRLTSDEGKRRKFHDTLVHNTVELCDLLKGLNMTGDPQLESARKRLEDALTGVTPDELRQQEGLREETKRTVDQILSDFDFGTVDEVADEDE